MKKSVYIITGALLLTGCASVAERNPNDPYERYNRTMYKFNDKADQYVMKPVARGYEKVVPQVARTGISNFFDNLRDVVSLGSNVLRGDLSKAGTDLVRVTVNSTVGLGGLINIADKEGIPNNKNTLGDTFASWGWKKSNYFVYPLLGPSTVRDSVGNTIVSAYPVENAIIHDKIARYALSGTKMVDKRAKLLPVTDLIDNTNPPDKYAYTRDMFMAARNHEIGIKPADNSVEEVDIDELLGKDNAPVVSTTASQTVSVQNVSRASKKAKPKQRFADETTAQYVETSELQSNLSPFSQQIWQNDVPE